MKNMFYRRKWVRIMFSILLSGCLCLTACTSGYVKSEDRSPLAVSKYRYGLLGEDELPVSSFFGPFGKGVKIESYRLLAEAGVNTVMDFGNWVTDDVEVVKRPLEYTSELGLSYILQDMKVLGINNGYIPDSAEDADFRSRLAHYRTFRSFAGIYGKDEPVIEQLDIVRAAADLITEYNEAEGTDILFYSNMLPNWPIPIFSEIPNNSAVTYEMLLSAYCETVRPKFLSFDRYPFEGAKGVKAGWFDNLAKIRKYAQQYHIPFWGCIQTGGDFPDAPYLRQNTETEFLWSINTLLAYGCQGLSFFPGVQPNAYASAKKGTVGLLDIDGTPTRYFDYAKNFSTQLRAIQSFLVNSVNLGVIAVGESPDAIRDREIPVMKEFRELSGVSGTDPALVGCFDYRGKTMLYVVANALNADTVCTVTLNFSDDFGYRVINEGVLEDTGGRTLKLELAAGHGALVVLQ